MQTTKTTADYQPSPAVKVLVQFAASQAQVAADNTSDFMQSTFNTMRTTAMGALRAVVVDEMWRADTSAFVAVNDLIEAAQQWCDAAIAEHLAESKA